MKKWLNVKEAAELFDKSQRTIQRQAKQGKIVSRWVIGRGGNGKILQIQAPTNDKNATKTSDKTKNKMSLIAKNSTDNKLSSSATTQINHCEPRKNAEVTENKENNKSSQCTENSTVNLPQTNDINPKALNNKELSEKSATISINSTANLLGISTRAVFKQITNNKLQAIKVPKKGGGNKTLVYVSSLSLNDQEKYKALTLKASTNDTFSHFSEIEKRIGLAKETVIKTWLQYRQQAKKEGYSFADANKRFDLAVASGEILANKTKLLGSFKAKTIQNWYTAWNKAGKDLTVLCGKRSNAGRKSERHDKFFALLGDIFKAAQSTTIKGIYKDLANDFEFKGLEFPSYRKACLFIEKLKANQNRPLAINRGYQAGKLNESYVIRKQDAKPVQAAQSDGYRVKILCYGRKDMTKLVRPLVVWWQDINTQAVLGWAISETERADVVASSFRHLASRFPVPKIVMFDNATSYKNVIMVPKYFAGLKAKKFEQSKMKAIQMLETGYQGFFEQCGVEKVSFVTPRHPWSKKIEAANHYVFNPFETLPKWNKCYTGKNPLDRPEHMQKTNDALIKEYGDQIPTWDYLIEELEKYFEKYNNTPQKRLGGFSPMQAIKQYLDVSPELKMMNQQELDYNTLWREEVKPVRKRIKIQGLHYEHPLFEFKQNFIAMYDVNDLSTVRIADLDGKEYDLPATLANYGSYVDQELSVEAIKANQRYQKTQKSMLINYIREGGDLKNLTHKELNKLANNAGITGDERLRIDQQIKELVKYPKAEIESTPRPKPIKRTQELDPLEEAEKQSFLDNFELPKTKPKKEVQVIDAKTKQLNEQLKKELEIMGF